MTPAERESLLQDLDQSREALLRTVDGLTPQQFEYREAAGRWTAAECLEHIDVAEFGMMRWLENALADASKPPHAGDWAGKDDALRQTMLESRQLRFEAPETILPTGRWAVSKAGPKIRTRPPAHPRLRRRQQRRSALPLAPASQIWPARLLPVAAADLAPLRPPPHPNRKT